MVESKNIVVFASGTGSNFKSIYKDIRDGKINGEILLLISNNSNCKAIDFARENGIEVSVINNEIINNSDKYESFLIQILGSIKTDLIVLAGYLKIIPSKIISKYRNKILNIHPSLLPKFGGKGFYGMNVHKSVIEEKEKFTGATVHFVDEVYDNGPIILQRKIEVLKNDSPESIASKVLSVEHALFPYVVRKFCSEDIIFKGNKPIITGDKEW